MEVKAPTIVRIGKNDKNIFLAGSIEMGTAEQWQDYVANRLTGFNFIFNPRRDDWDSTWAQEESNQQFIEQVHWELNHLHRSDVVLFVFDKNTKSPITLLELGLMLSDSLYTDKVVVVVCPKEFWRSGNVYITAKKFCANMCETIDEAIEFLNECC